MLDFPDSPTNGQVVTLNSAKYTWNATKGVWQASTSLDSPTIISALGFTPYDASNPAGYIDTVDYVNPTAFYYSARTITADKTILSTENAMSVGTVTIADGVTVTVEDGGEWSIV